MPSRITPLHRPDRAPAPAAESPRLDLVERPRRNRKADWARRLVREATLTPDDLIWPIFLADGARRRDPVSSMPGVERMGVAVAVAAAERAASLGIPVLALFPYTDPDRRDETGREALNAENLAVYPKRLGTNRPNAYAKPGNFKLLGKGMPSFETRHCNRAVPGISNQLPTGTITNPLPVPIPGLPTSTVNQALAALVPQPLLDNLNKFVFSQLSNSQTAAPPCYSQGPYTTSGETTQYPHVKAK